MNACFGRGKECATLTFFTHLIKRYVRLAPLLSVSLPPVQIAVRSRVN